MSYRRERLTEQFIKETTKIIKHEVKDPNIDDMASIIRADITQDLSYAKLYVSIYGDEDTKDRTIKGLEHASGYIRSKLGKKLRIRKVPELSFVLDDSIEYSIKLEEKFRQINKGQGKND